VIQILSKSNFFHFFSPFQTSYFPLYINNLHKIHDKMVSEKVMDLFNQCMQNHFLTQKYY